MPRRQVLIERNTNISNQKSMSGEQSPKIHINLQGIGGLRRKRMEFLFSKQQLMHCELEEDSQKADIVIADIDDYKGKEALEKRNFSHVPFIVLGRNAVKVRNGRFLKKPIQSGRLLEAIFSLAKKIDARERGLSSAQPNNLDTYKVPTDTSSASEKTAVDTSPSFKASKAKRERLSRESAKSLNEREEASFIGSRGNVDLSDPSELAGIQYDPGRFLAYRIHELMHLAIGEKCYIRMICFNTPFFIDPHEYVVHTPATEKKLRSFCFLPMGDSDFEYKQYSGPPADMEENTLCYEYEVFIWRMTLFTSRGRIPLGTDLNQAFRLQRWPNLTRLLLFPHATQIAAFWISSGKSIREVVGELEIPQRYVFAFFSAASLMGYLQPATITDQDNTLESTTEKRNKRGLFRRLLGHLYNKLGEQ